jgi:hypothetical protein
MVQLKCASCGRHLGEAETIIADLLCPNSSCRASTQFKILNNDISGMARYKFAAPAREPKKKEVKHEEN